MTDPGAVAPMPRPAQGDHTAGLALALGILAALRLAERTGEGQAVDASLLGTAAWTMATDLSAVLVDGREPTKRDRHHLISPLANRFLCGDGRWIVLTMPEVHWWPRFCDAFGRPEWITDPRFDTMKNRFDNMPALIDLMDAEFATRPRRRVGTDLRPSRAHLGTGLDAHRAGIRSPGGGRRAVPDRRPPGGIVPHRCRPRAHRRCRHRTARARARDRPAHRRGAGGSRVDARGECRHSPPPASSARPTSTSRPDAPAIRPSSGAARTGRTRTSVGPRARSAGTAGRA